MSDLLPNIRNAVRAIIVQGDKVLLLEKHCEGRDFYALPGGGQEAGESLIDTLQRECYEEIGCYLRDPVLLHVADYLRPRTTNPPTKRHLVEFIFVGAVDEQYEPKSGAAPDQYQIGVAWVDQKHLQQFPFLPESFIQSLSSGTLDRHDAYLGIVKP